jgi:hypothetical protein
MTTTHRGRHPSRGRPPPGPLRHPRALPPAPLPTPQPQATALCTPAWPAWSPSRSSAAAPAPHLARVRHRPPLTNATSAASPASGPARPSIEPLQDAAAHRASTRSVVTVAAASTCSPPPPPEGRRDGRVRTDGGGQQPPGHRTAGHRTAGHRTGWTLDALDTQTAGHWTARPSDPDDATRWVDTTWWTRTGDRRHGRHPGLADHGDHARPLDAGWTLRRAAAVWATNQPGQRGSRTTGTGPATAATVHCRCSAVQLAPRRTAVLGKGWGRE